MKRKQVTCNCSAYPFPHRNHGGKCQSCRHGKNWLGLYEMYVLENRDGEWCDDCAYEEGFRGEPSETLSAWERNRGASWLRG